MAKNQKDKSLVILVPTSNIPDKLKDVKGLEVRIKKLKEFEGVVKKASQIDFDRLSRIVFTR
jgi:hypothetical protein